MNANEYLHMNREQLISIINAQNSKIDALNSKIEAQNSEIEANKIEIKTLSEKVKSWETYFFIRKTEKLKSAKDDPRQLWLFNEFETHADEQIEEVEEVNKPKKISKRGKRKPLPKNLERRTRYIGLSEKELICACGTIMCIIGSVHSEQLVVRSPEIYVEETVRYKYACPNCEGTEDPDKPTVRIAELPVALLPKSIASPSLLTQVVYDKFCNGLPLYRQSNIWKSLGIDISVSDMSRWAITAADKCSPLYSLLIKTCVESHVINMDETPLLVMKEPHRTNEQKSYMWVMCGTSEHPTRIFYYASSRGHHVAEDLLASFKGYLQTDGLAGYKIVGQRDGVEHVACLAHIRRKFVNIQKAAGTKRKPGIADAIVIDIGKIYEIEKNLREKLANNSITKEDFLTQRKQQAEPILNQIINTIHEYIPKTPPTSLLGKALSYASKQWADMTRYLECPDLTPDNNKAENAIRPFVIGRKNWLFAGSPRGAFASSFFYTLIETAKCNGLDPRAYLAYVLENIASATTPEQLEDLLPWNYKNKL